MDRVVDLGVPAFSIFLGGSGGWRCSHEKSTGG